MIMQKCWQDFGTRENIQHKNYSTKTCDKVWKLLQIFEKCFNFCTNIYYIKQFYINLSKIKLFDKFIYKVLQNIYLYKN